MLASRQCTSSRNACVYNRTHALPGLSMPARRRQLTACVVAEAAASGGKVIAMYTKPGCELCEGTRDRVQGIIDRAQFMPSAIAEWRLEERDITTNPAWAVYEMEVPVLVASGSDGREVRLPRWPPRMTTDKLRQHIEASLPQ
ncbi:hypothetical protein CHLRE_07g357300v5 [Chlamydomonas reinhardtii]|uniref:Glutaredoxin-like protein n=1 Tax=Chlamydomonas reinhardtii TaxID=3055 RepID=A0A2K3DLR7_CHLRE|nr:uncharacterized protein CHLRE_07g357300v5 [Chlamydomonas reinhardtii]PNW81470.1 hypothetical protein CHLRE_07g357300v5 [Chlamydomonas reinhardtii]